MNPQVKGRSRLHPIVCVSLIVLWVIVTAAAFADGCYIPERAVLKIAEIPAQRAVLKWKDGMETLLISSALNSQSQKLGWIIPLPSTPITMEKADPGSLKTLTFCIQPRITHDLFEMAKVLTILTVLANLLVVTFLFKRSRFGHLVALILIFTILGSMVLSAGMSGSSRLTTLQVETTARVGSYEVSVLRAQNADGLNTWLSENGFANFPETATPILTRYIQGHWVFVAIKLAREVAGANTPHPIKLVFSATEAVYPLQLTSLAGGKTQFELFILGDKRAGSAQLKTQFCDKFEKKENEDFRNWRFETPEQYKASYSGQVVGHPEVCGLMWDGCVLTKLTGLISSEQMADDIRIVWSKFNPCQQHFYTAQGATSVAYVLFLLFAGGFLLVSMIVYRNSIRQPSGKHFYVFERLLPGVLASLVAALVLYAVVPKIDSRGLQFYHRSLSWSHITKLQYEVEDALERDAEMVHKTETEIAENILNIISGYEPDSGDSPRRKAVKNPVIGGLVKIETTPGNLTVKKEDDKVVVRVYDQFGRSTIKTFP